MPEDSEITLPRLSHSHESLEHRMIPEDIDSVEPDYIQCVLGHLDLEKTDGGVYCRECEVTYERWNVVNRREEAMRYARRRER